MDKHAIALTAALIVAAACGGVQLGSRPTPTPRPSQSVPARNAAGQNLDATEFYRRWGMLAQGAPMPFTGSIGFLAAPRDDSTHAMVSLSMAAGTLKFNREGDGYRADYRVSITFSNDGATVARIDAAEPLRVATLRETRRTDESVLFQQVLTVPPGQYTMALAVRDEGSGLSSNQDVIVRVPRFGDGTVTAPLAYYDVIGRTARDSLPRLVASPRAVATFGMDSVIALYLEAYGPQSPGNLMVAVRVDSQTVWTDTVALTKGDGLATGTARVPVSRIGLGVAVAHVWQPGGGDTTYAPIFVGIGDELPTTTYRDMLSYLRFFTTPARLAQLEAVSPALRGDAWRDFARETDPAPATPENEALTDYLVRLRRANERFLGEGAAGWKTDRGMVLLLLGEPDGVVDQGANDVSQRGRVQRWEYNTLGYSVEFLYVPGTSQWRLASATEAQLRDAAHRRVGP